MKNKNYTWVVKDSKGEIVRKLSSRTREMTKAIYYGKFEEVIQYITLKEFKEMATLEIYNNGFDNVKHRPITKEQIEKMLDKVSD